MEDTSPTQVVASIQSASASTDVAVVPEEPRPRPTSNLEFPCPKCQNVCCVGQFYCGKCSEPLRELAHSNVRRSLQLARLRAVNDICSRSGMKPSALSVEEIRGGQTVDLSAWGLLSLDAEATQDAKKQFKSAIKLGYSGILDRFTKDVAFALRSTERGLTRSAMMVQDRPQHGAAYPGHGLTGKHDLWRRLHRRKTARLLYLRDDRSALLKAGLISSMTDTPIAISWLGAVYSVTEFAAIIEVTNQVSRLVTFGISTVTWDPEFPPFERSRESAVQYLRHIVAAAVEAAERTARKQEEDAKRSQQAQPKYSEPYPAKG